MPLTCIRTIDWSRINHAATVRRMPYAKLKTALLKDVGPDYYYGASCGSCLHASRLNLDKLRRYLGYDFPLTKVRERLKCELCGARKAVITFLAPDQRTGALVHLFNKPVTE